MERAFITCRQANALDLVDYLGGLGHQPVKVRRQDYWYRSPLRKEHRPSFKVNRQLNRWYDHGLGSGGTLVDFGIRYHGCSVRELLETLATRVTLPPRHLTLLTERMQEDPKERIRILSEGPLQAPFLCRYLASRGISLYLARHYCHEVRYRLRNREYRAIGFRNDAGGYELRTPCFKASSSPKTVMTWDIGAREVVVLEGFMDFLAFRQLYPEKSTAPSNIVVLNSLAFFERTRAFLERHNTIRLWLDRDAAGKRCTQAALASSARYRDESEKFAPYKDLSEWLERRQAARHRIRQRLSP